MNHIHHTSFSELTDGEIVARAQQGDREAYGLLYDRYADAIFKFCYWQLHQVPAVAEDAVQDIFMQAAKSLQTFSGSGSFRNWLYAITKNVVMQYVKKRYEQNETPLFEDIIETEEWIDPGKQAEVIKKVGALLSTLPDRDREVLECRYLKQYSVQETARALQITPANVKVIAHRAIEKLRTA